MGEVSEAVLEQLSQGVSQVLNSEWQGWPLITAANTIANQGETLMTQINAITANYGVGKYKNVKDVVTEAAEKATATGKISGIKTRLANAFIHIRRDHSSSEDDELRSLLNSKKVEFDQEIMDIFKSYYGIYEQVAKKNSEIYSNNRFRELQQQANQLMQNGYIVLNKIGEAIHGTTIVYEVQLSIGTKGSQRTAYLTLEQIMKYTTAATYLGDTRLKLNEAALNQAIRNGEIQAFSWTDEYRQSFLEYTNRVRYNQLFEDTRDWSTNAGLTEDDWEDIFTNTGNVAESFRRAAAGMYDRWIEQGFGKTMNEIVNMSDHDIHYMIHTTISNTTAYWQGPDFVADLNKIFNGLKMSNEQKNNLMNSFTAMTNGSNKIGIQEKVSGASFTRLSQLVTQLRNAAQALSILRDKTAGSNIKSSIQKGITEGLDSELEQAVLDLVRQFLPGAS